MESDAGAKGSGAAEDGANAAGASTAGASTGCDCAAGSKDGSGVRSCCGIGLTDSAGANIEAEEVALGSSATCCCDCAAAASA